MDNATSQFPPLFVTLNNNEVTITLLIVNIIIFIIGFSALFLNAIVLDTLVKLNTEASDLIMCHLAATDMLTGVLVIYMAFYNIVYFQNVIDCLIRLGAVFTFLTSSVYHLALLTVDRFVKIVFPYRYEDVITKTSVSVASSVIWVFSVNLGLLPVYGWKDTPYPWQPQCAFLLVMPDDYLKLLMVTVFCVPLVVISFLYVKIFIVARRHIRVIAACNVMKRSDVNSWKFTQAVAIIIGTYICMFLPISVVIAMYLLDAFRGLSPLDVGDYIIYTSAATFLNSVVNPVIYAFKLPPVRKRFHAMLGRKATAFHSRSDVSASTHITDIGTHITDIQ